MKPIWLFLMVLVILTGCVRQDPLNDLVAFIVEVDARPTGRITPAPVYEPFEVVSYTASGQRSPFEVPRPLQLEPENNDVPQSNVRPDPNRIPEYLETFRIENIEMVGVLTGLGDSTQWALLRDSNNEIHRVKIGNYLGRNHGRIVDVAETQIQLIEIVPSGQNRWVERPRVIVLSGLEG